MPAPARRLLPGEPADTAEAVGGDAAHWVHVYTELIDLCRRSLRRGLPPDVVATLETRLHGYLERREVWQAAAAAGDQDAGS